MNIKSTPRYNELKEALGILQELEVSESLQEVALKHLLGTCGNQLVAMPQPVALPHPSPANTQPGDTRGLRDFIGSLKPKGAVAEIPCLMYWARENEGKDTVDEKGIIELYRRAGLRPPKNVPQSFRDLSSRKYGRLEAVEGQAGYVRLSRVGEDFVLHDLSGVA